MQVAGTSNEKVLKEGGPVPAFSGLSHKIANGPPTNKTALSVSSIVPYKYLEVPRST